MMRRVARTAGQTVGREHAHEADPVDLSRLLRAHRERPRDRCAAEKRDELAATDVDCHLTLSWKVMPMQWRDHITLERAACLLHARERRRC